MTERDRLDLRGLLPPNVMSPEQQIDRFSKFALLAVSHSPMDFFLLNQIFSFIIFSSSFFCLLVGYGKMS